MLAPVEKKRSTPYVNSTSSKTNDARPDESPADMESDSDKCEQCTVETGDKVNACCVCVLRLRVNA